MIPPMIGLDNFPDRLGQHQNRACRPEFGSPRLIDLSSVFAVSFKKRREKTGYSGGMAEAGCHVTQKVKRSLAPRRHRDRDDVNRA